MSLRKSDGATEEVLQERLQILLHRLRWSYVNLWTLNPRTRVLEWKRGHFEVANAKAGEAAYAQLFYSTYKPCCCKPGVGAVGRANREGKRIWLTGDAVCQLAGSIEKSQFLKCAEIKTTMCIPWVDSVLEIGTINVQVLANDLLSTSPELPEFAAFEHAAKLTTPAAAMNPGFHQDVVPPNLTLQQQQRPWPRSSNNLSFSLRSDISELQPNDLVKENLAFGHVAEPEILVNQTVNLSRGLMTDHQYRSLWSSAAVASSSREGVGSPARTHSVSPELQQQIHASPRFCADEGNPDSGQFPGLRNLQQIRRTNSCGDQYDIRKYHTLHEAQEMHHQWQRNPASELAANSDEATHRLPTGQTLPCHEASWQGDTTFPDCQIPKSTDSVKRRAPAARSNVKLVNQVSKIAGPLLRRQSLTALELLKDVKKFQEDATEVSNGPSYDMRPQTPTTHVQIRRPSPQGRRPRSPGPELASRSSGPVVTAHDEASENHMLAERRRRTKQKENFSALRKLVPIISKTSTLVDAITYLQMLQNQVRKLEASKEATDQQCAILESQCKGLKERNQELLEWLSKGQPAGGGIHLNLVHLKLKSMNST